MSEVEIIDVENFLRNNNNFILLEHQAEILEYISYIKSFINMDMQTTKHGCHYISCPYSSENTSDGPDTCKCCKVEIIQKNLCKIINLYKRLLKK